MLVYIEKSSKTSLALQSEALVLVVFNVLLYKPLYVLHQIVIFF